MSSNALWAAAEAPSARGMSSMIRLGGGIGRRWPMAAVAATGLYRTRLGAVAVAARSLLLTRSYFSQPFLRLQAAPTPLSSSSSSSSSPFSPTSFPSSFSSPSCCWMLRQARPFGTNGMSPMLLASREAAANRSPNNAAAQTAFYQLLLRAGMPQMVVERYESGRFAVGDAGTEAYHRALQMLSGGGAAAISSSPSAGAGIPHHLHGTGAATAHTRAAAQAAAARAAGHDISISSVPGGGGGGSGSGSPGDPLNIMTHESGRTFAFRVFRWVVVFGFVVYVSMTLVTLIIEYTTVVKRPGGAKNEYQAVKSQHQTVRFADVHGCEEAKDELQELVEFLRDPAKFSTLGGKLPKGVLLMGPPGTGKTLLARAVAGEAGVPFFYMSGSEFDEVFVGMGARRVRDLFGAAKAKSPSIIFIDELDAIGGKRSARDFAYSKQTLNQLLTELDGFEQGSGVIIIAATNFPKLLDKALTRPGRFDRHIVVDLPDVRGRIAVLRHHASKVKMDGSVNLEALASSTPGLSGADLANIINQAAVHASRMKAPLVRQEDLDWAKDKAVMGAEKRSMVVSDKEKLMTAYHEAGHALVVLHNEAFTTKSKLYKVTILPRGLSLGHTAFLPEMDSHSATAVDIQASIAVSLAGKVAEELAYGERRTTSGVSADLQSATDNAFRMVTQFGMSKLVGPVDFGGNRYELLSSETRAQIESEVQRLLMDSYEDVRKVLTSRHKELDRLAQALVEYETLDRDEVERVIRGQALARPKMSTGKLVLPARPHQEIGMTDVEPSGGDRDPPSTPGGIITTPK